MKRTLTILLMASSIVCSAADKPNIIFILADDLSYRDLGCFGQKQFSTPNIDRLAKEGRIFANAYAGGPWCAPSRTALLTGRNAAHFAPPANAPKDKRGRPTKFNPTLAEMLKSAGYATAAIGKWHMQEPHDTWFFGKQTRAEQRAAENPMQMPWHRGFDVSYIGYSFGLDTHFPHQIETGDTTEISIPQNAHVDGDRLHKEFKSAQGWYDAQGRFVDAAGNDSSKLVYAEDLYRAEALKFLRANKDHPFFLYYATPLVHGPLAVKELGPFKDKPAPWTQCHKLWAGMVEYLDGSVGILLDEVKKLGLEKNTIIIFASDNGYAEWGYFGRGAWSDDPVFLNKGPWNRGKFVNTNGGNIVPMIAWCPGRIPAGKTDRAVVLYDVMATLGELAGAKLPGPFDSAHGRPTDGVSFVPLLEGRDQDQPLRSAIHWATQGNYGLKIPDDCDPQQQRAQFLPPAVLLDEKWYAMQLGQTVRVFDITADPGMKHDLSGAHPELVARARSEFQKLSNVSTSLVREAVDGGPALVTLRNQLLDQHSITLDAPDPKAPDLMIGNAEMGGLVAPDGLGVDRAFRADFFKTTISRLPILPVRLQAETADGNTPGVASYRQTMRLADGIVRTHVEYAGAMGGYDAEVFFDNDPARKNLLVIRVTPFGAAGKLNWFAKLPVEFEKRPNYWDGWQNDKPFPVSAEDLYDAAQPATHRVSGTVKPHRLDPKPLAPKTNYCDDDGYALGSSYPNPFVPFPGEPSTPHWEASCTRALTKVAGRGRYALAPGDDGITLVFAAASLNWTAFTPEENAALANPATFDALRAGHIAAWKKDWEKTPVIITPEERYNQLYYRSLFWLLSTAGSKKFLPGEAQFGCDCWGMSPFTVGHAGWGIHALYRLGHSERGRRMIGNFADLDTLRDNGAVFLRKKGTGAMCVPHMFGSTVKYFFDYAEQQHLIAFAESFLQLPVIFETPGSQDEYFRNVLYPASKGFALFWMNLDTTKETSADGRQSGLVYRPLRSLSENLIERNPLDAVLAAKWCLNTAADYADRLRVDAAEAKAWRQRANDILLSTRNTDNGPIFAEWFGDTVRKAGAYQGIRSPVYLGWPTDQTQVFDRDICLRTLDDAFVRNDKGIGGIPFVTTWLALAELRFGRGDRAYEWMENNFYSRDSRVGCIYEFKPPKSRARNPYFGTCQDAYLVALCEMLLQTDGPTYKLFPAVPSQWKHIVMLHMPAGAGRTCSAIYDNGQITARKITNERKTK